MTTSNVSALLAGASLVVGCTTPQHTAKADDAVAMLVRKSEESNQLLMRGDIDRYAALMAHAGDFTLMSPFGGEPSHGLDRPQIERMRGFFKNGELTQELVSSYGTADMVVLAIIERARVEVGGLPMQNWALRVTLVYRRAGDDWQLVHRHADPLVHGISRQHAAVLGRGEEI